MWVEILGSIFHAFLSLNLFLDYFLPFPHVCLQIIFYSCFFFRLDISICVETVGWPYRTLYFLLNYYAITLNHMLLFTRYIYLYKCFMYDPLVLQRHVIQLHGYVHLMESDPIAEFKGKGIDNLFLLTDLYRVYIARDLPTFSCAFGIILSHVM
ncbi:hypothetical protein ACJX0J_026597, partial [Zea mays]